MHITQPTSLSLDLASVMRGLRVTLGFWGVRRSMSEALMALVSRLLERVCARLERLEARFFAGTLRRSGPRVVVVSAEGVVERAAVAAAVMAATADRGGERIWPFRFGWLLPLMGPFRHEGVARGTQLRAILERPELVALLIAAPQARRILLPLCRMLAVESSVLRPRVAGDAKAMDGAAPDGPARPVVVRTRVSRRREEIVHLRPLQPWVLAAARHWKKLDGE